MKSKVVIENSQTIIELFPENEFEKDVIEKSSNKKIIKSKAYCDLTYGHYTNHKIELNIGGNSSPDHSELIQLSYNRSIELLRAIYSSLKECGSFDASNPIVTDLEGFMNSPCPFNEL